MPTVRIDSKCDPVPYNAPGWEDKYVTFETDLEWISITFFAGSPFKESTYLIKRGNPRKVKVMKGKGSSGGDGIAYPYCLLDGEIKCPDCKPEDSYAPPPKMIIRK